MEYFGFTETIRFQRNAEKIFNDDELGELQLYLSEFPERGQKIPGSEGIRKLRWTITGRGKRGGARIIYFVAVSRYRILLLDIYAKNEKEDLSKSELKNLREAVEVWLNEK